MILYFESIVELSGGLVIDGVLLHRLWHSSLWHSPLWHSPLWPSPLWHPPCYTLLVTSYSLSHGTKPIHLLAAYRNIKGKGFPLEGQTWLG